MPEGLTVVTARVRLPAGPRTRPGPRGESPSITLPCPAGMRFAGLQLPPEGTIPIAFNIPADTIPGSSTGAQIQIAHGGLHRPLVATVGINCRRPDANGSIATEPRPLRSGERIGHVCRVRSGVVLLRKAPNGRARDYINLGAPVAIQKANASGAWTRVVPDDKHAVPGWIKTSALCP